MSQQQVILLINEREAPSLTLLDALSGVGLTPLIETMRGAEETTHGVMRYERNAFAHVSQPVAVIYEATDQCATPELCAVAEYVLKIWRGVPLIACRRTLPENRAPNSNGTGAAAHGARHDDATLQRIGFHLIVNTPAQLAEILREGNSNNSARRDAPAQFPGEALTGEDFAHENADFADPAVELQLPATLREEQLRAAYKFLAALHLTGNRYQAAQRAVEHLNELVTAERWTLYQNIQPSTSAGGGSGAQQLQLLASWTAEEIPVSAVDDVFAELRRVAQIPGDDVKDDAPQSSTAARTALCLGTVVRRAEDENYYLALPLIGGERVFGVLEGVRRPAPRNTFTTTSNESGGSFSADETQFMTTLTAPLAAALNNAWRLAEANRLTQTDDLTGLYNARYLREHLAREVSRARRYGSCVTTLFLDLDNFKNVNDMHGHLVGSQVLVELANLLRASVRDTDVIARYGGDEFVLVMPETNPDQACRAAERLCESITQYVFDGGRGLEMRLTASLGVATYPLHAPTPQLLIAQADAAMYDAKAAGKGCVRYAPEPDFVEFSSPSFASK